LHKPLGAWLHSAHLLRPKWPYYFEHQSGNLYIRTTAGYTPKLTDTPGTFSEYLSHLDSWEKELFEDLIMEVDCYEFLDLVDSQLILDDVIRLITVSDGSDASGSMSFGWVIALPNGRRLA
jgi:hypothetical protein